MGFTTGFLGGATLTTALLYGTLLAHKRNRHAQALSLRHSQLQLNQVLSPKDKREPIPEGIVREERAGVVETAKDRWNAELANAVRWVQETDWRRVREVAEEDLGGLAEKLRKKADEAAK